MATMLDDNQRKAIYLPFNESVIVEAPPGHGKTFVMARRIEFLIEAGFIKPPKKILGLTFTNAAAGEMLDDIKARVDEKHLDLIRVMTFHSLCYKILRAYGNLLGFNRNFKILSEVEQEKTLQGASKTLSLPYDESQFSYWHKERHLKNNPGYTSQYSNIASRIYEEYVRELGSDKVDYDNLLLRTIALFETYPAVLDTYRSLFKYILVDEFQDTNPLQFKLLKLLVQGSDVGKTEGLSATPVFILADEAQAIYKFQAATPENIGLAKATFNCSEIELNVNHRINSESILSFTGALRGKNNKPSLSKVSVSICANPVDEANLVLDRIVSFKGDLHDVGVIAQTQYLLLAFRTLLDERKIPYVFVPDFSAKAIEKRHENIFEKISLLYQEKNFTGTLSTRIRQIYAENLNGETEDDVLKALLSLASSFDARNRQLPFAEKALQFYNDIFVQLNWGNLLRKRVRNKIFLSTIHGVKGLQFSQVHILRLVCFEHIHRNVCWPCGWGKNIKTISSQLDDAHKTLYVGATRAQDILYLYSVQKSNEDKIRKIVCLLSPYKEFLDIQGSLQFCGSLTP